MKLDFVFLGLSITSSWGNGHATTYRGLCKSLVRRGHRVRFLERDLPFYADNRDAPDLGGSEVSLYEDLDDLRARFSGAVREADVVVVGSYVPEGVAVAGWALDTARGAVAFYDIDTPVTLAKLARGDGEYLSRELVPRFDLYLSFTGGPTLRLLERELGAQRAEALYCSVDPEGYFPEPGEPLWDLSYLGTYSDDRQPSVDELLCRPARAQSDLRFIVAGPQYPDSIAWPGNVARKAHLPPGEHRAFYSASRFTLNVTRRDMIKAGHSPSVRLFEAAACATPIVSDAWAGLAELFVPGEEIHVVRSGDEVLSILGRTPEEARRRVGERARARILAEHTAMHRAESLENFANEVLGARARARQAYG